MKIQKKVTEVSMVEIEIDLPFYSKNKYNSVAYAILSETSAWIVYSNDSKYSEYYNIASSNPSDTIEQAMALPTCTKEEFESFRDSIVNKSNLS